MTSLNSGDDNNIVTPDNAAVLYSVTFYIMATIIEIVYNNKRIIRQKFGSTDDELFDTKKI